MENKYGVDVAYFRKELNLLKRSLPNRTKSELYRYLIKLAEIVKEDQERLI